MRACTGSPPTLLVSTAAPAAGADSAERSDAAHRSADGTAGGAAAGSRLLAFTGWLEEDHEQSVLTVDTATRQVHAVARGGGRRPDVDL